MSTLGTIRHELSALLGTATEFTPYAYRPARFTAPFVFVVPGSPYVQAGDTFGTFEVRLVGAVAVSAVNNETATGALDTAAEEAIVAAVNAGWSVDSVSEPYPYSDAGGGQLLAVDIAASKTTSL